MSIFSRYKTIARTFDWLMAILTIPFAGYMLWSTWPHPGLWTIVSFAMIPVSFILAAFDWQKHIDITIRAWLIQRTLS